MTVATRSAARGPGRVILAALFLSALFQSALFLAGTNGLAHAADGKGVAGVPAKDAGAPTGSMGAAGLTGTGATKDGARTGTGESKAPAVGAKPPSAPAAGTTR
jgi:hypothetical protein